jgi:ankyrin repeat protein
MEKVMNTQSSESPVLDLIPTLAKPLSLLDLTSMFDDLLNEHGAEFRLRFRQLYLEDKERDVKVGIGFNSLTMHEIESLAKGEEIRTPCGDVEAPGRLRLMRGHEGDTLVMVLLEFLPDESVPQGMTFDSWFGLRFLNDCSYLHESRNEEWWLYFHALWVEETQPNPTLAPDDGLLHTAVLNNHEQWVEAILKRQPRIEVQQGTEKSISETALGIAMENTGMFGAGPGFMCACHRHYRDDDFTQAEDEETWVPRAERISEQLKAAGAIDYSPMLKACRAGRAEEVEAMLKQGFPPNFSIYGHTTALCEAAQPGHEDICDLLLCHGANPNMPRPFYTSMTFGGEIYPLSLATEHPAILKRLLEAGADPNQQRDDSEETPVVLAMKFETREQAEEVFDLVDFASIRGKFGRSGAFYLDATQLELCHHVIPADLLNEQDGRGMTSLLHAITFEDVAKARLLIEMGADPTQPGMIWEDEANCMLRMVDTGRIPTQYLTPIQAALQTGDLDLVEYLLDLGAPAPRHSLGLKISNIKSDEEYFVLRDKLQADLADLDGCIRLTTSRYGPSFSNERTRHCEILLATLLLNQPASTATRYPELIERIDLVDWAEQQSLHPAAIEPFRSGRKLGKVGWMQLLDEALSGLQNATKAFGEALSSPQTDDANCADTCDLLGPLKHAEQTLLAATARITGKVLKPLNLSAEVCERASGDFKGGTARAYRDAETTGKVGVDDFIEALAEHFSSGSTMDHGKLLQAVRLVTVRLEKRCAILRGKI